MNLSRSIQSRPVEFPERAAAQLGIATGAPLMVAFAFRNGDRAAFSYAHLYRVDCDGDATIVMWFLEHLVRLRGTRLAALASRIEGQRIAEIVEHDPLQAAHLSDQPLVMHISIDPLPDVPTAALLPEKRPRVDQLLPSSAYPPLA